MKRERLIEKNYKNFVGHWCLYKEYNHQCKYEKFFIYDIKDGIAKISYDKDKLEYIDLDTLVNGYCYVSPFDANEQMELTKENNDISGHGRRSTQQEFDTIKPYNPTPWISFGDNPFDSSISKSKDKDDGISIWNDCKTYYIDDKACDHEWQESSLLSMPPIFERKCSKCGAKQHRRELSTTWKNGSYLESCN